MPDIGNPRPMGIGVLGNVGAFPFDMSPGGRQQAGKHAQQARLATAIGAGQQDGAAGIDREVQSREHGSFPADAREIVGGQSLHGVLLCVFKVIAGRN